MPVNNYLSIINFVRDVEPRCDDDSYLYPTVVFELDLCRRYGFPNTLLLQYDALIDEKYISLIKERSAADGNIETGLWFEVVEPLCRAVGIPWRGRYPWDWHADVGFLTGYEPGERITLIDECFEKFRSVFGYHPTSVGSWFIDAVSLKYMKEKYGVRACCICKEQSLTDGYTLWGGIWSGGYYPSPSNSILPASGDEDIHIPTFRMLGADPIRQYDMGLGDPSKCQGVASLEPVYSNSGAGSEWVENFLDLTFRDDEYFAFTQTGQENSFGKESIEKGLEAQFEIIDRYVKEGRFEIKNLTDVGDIFASKYETTPVQYTLFEKTVPDDGSSTFWYQCRKFRLNIHSDERGVRIRDFQLYSPDFKEKYIDTREESHEAEFRALPVIDGFRFSDEKIVAGIYIGSNPREFTVKTEGERAEVTLDNGMQIILTPEGPEFTGEEISLEWLYSESAEAKYAFQPGKISIEFAGNMSEPYRAELTVEGGVVSQNKITGSGHIKICC